MSNEEGVVIELLHAIDESNNVSLSMEGENSEVELVCSERIEVDIGVGAKGDKPVKGVDYWTPSDRLEMLREVREALSYDEQYDLSQEVLSDEISGEELVYDHVQRAWRVFGEVRIAVPERSDYYLSIALAQRFDEGNITVGSEVVPISDNMTFLLRDVDEVVFSVDIYIWVKAIAVQGFRPIIVPTKVSDLDNDLGFLAGSVDGEVLNLGKDITGQGGKPIIVPTKVSELENDLEFVSASIEDRVLNLKS